MASFSVSEKDSSVAGTKLMVWNIANARRDNEKSPLYDRLDTIISVVNQVNPDVLVFLEAGRPSKSLVTGIEYSWSQMASKIEEATGLIHEGVWRMAPQLMAFGKAVFVKYNNPTVAVQIEQLFVGDDDKMWCDQLHGTVLKVTFNPFDGTNIIPSKQHTLGVVHFPMPLNKRLFYAQWLAKHNDQFDFIAGDMNTFPDSGGAEILSILEQAGYTEQLPGDTKFTFKGFKHDVITIPNKDMVYHPHSTVVETTDTHTSVIPVSWLDHVLSKAPLKASIYEVDETSSDHFPLIVDFSYDVSF